MVVSLKHLALNHVKIGPLSSGGSVGPTPPDGVPHRYWGIQTAENNGDALGAFGELELYDAFGGENLASRKPTLSNITPTRALAFEGASGLDNLLFAGSSSGFLAPSKTYRIWCDLASQPFPSGSKAIVGVKMIANELTHAGKMPKSFDVIYSDDGVNWTVHYSVTNQTNWTAFEMRDFFHPGYAIPTYTGNPHIGFSWYSLYLLGGSASTYGVREMTFRTTPGVPATMPLPVYEQGGGVTGQCFYGTQGVPVLSTNPPNMYSSGNYMFDANASTFWQSTDTGIGQMIGYQYAKDGGVVLVPTKISEVTITSYLNQAPLHCIVRGSTNAVKQTSLFSFKTSSWSDGQTQVFTMPQYI